MRKATQNDKYPLYAKIACQYFDTYTSTPGSTVLTTGQKTGTTAT